MYVLEVCILTIKEICFSVHASACNMTVGIHLLVVAKKVEFPAPQLQFSIIRMQKL